MKKLQGMALAKDGHPLLFNAEASSILVVLSACTSPVYGITHLVDDKDREGCHALALFLAKCIIEWLPRLGELIQIG